jgi:SAM-dependent methyltransferase
MTNERSGELAWTGERFVPEIHGNIALEHWHRYAFACEIAAGKSVLDIACGEGYGSAMLAEVARSVVGVDISREAIGHASKRYVKSNLEFKVGSCAEIALASRSIDLVVSFETIEHHDQHREMFLEIKRVLRPDGVLVISSPDKYEYSVAPGYSNPYHVRELYRYELEELLGKQFKRFAIYGQRIVYGSGILLEGAPAPVHVYSSDRRHDAVVGMPHPQYLIAVASDETLPPAPSGIFEQPIADSDVVRWWANAVAERDRQIRCADSARTELEARLIEVTATKDQQLQVETARVQEVEARLGEVIAAKDQQLQVETARVREVEARLGEVIAAKNRQLQAETARVQEAQARLGELIAAKDRQLQAETVRVQEAEARLAEVIEAKDRQLEAETARAQGLGADLRAALVERDEAVQALQVMNRDLRAEVERRGALEEELSSERTRLRELRERLAARDEVIQVVYSSTSWRVTAPLRGAMDIVRRWRRHF